MNTTAPTEPPAHLPGMENRTSPGQQAAIDARITASRMERIDACEWMTPAVREALTEYAADLRSSIPLTAMLERIRRVLEADRAERETRRPAEQPDLRLVS